MPRGRVGEKLKVEPSRTDQIGLVACGVNQRMYQDSDGMDIRLTYI